MDEKEYIDEVCTTLIKRNVSYLHEPSGIKITSMEYVKIIAKRVKESVKLLLLCEDEEYQSSKDDLKKYIDDIVRDFLKEEDEFIIDSE